MSVMEVAEVVLVVMLICMMFVLLPVILEMMWITLNKGWDALEASILWVHKQNVKRRIHKWNSTGMNKRWWK